MYKASVYKVPNKPVSDYRESEVLKQLLKAADEVCPGRKRYTIPILVEKGSTVPLIIDGATDEECLRVGESVDTNYRVNVHDDSPYHTVDVSALLSNKTDHLTLC